MKIMFTLSDQIEDELRDAEKYIDCAYEKKSEYPELAAIYLKLSKEEMVHANLIHDQVVKIIENYKQSNEVPPAMKAFYEYLHSKYVDWALKIELKQKNFK